MLLDSIMLHFMELSSGEIHTHLQKYLSSKETNIVNNLSV